VSQHEYIRFTPMKAICKGGVRCPHEQRTTKVCVLQLYQGG